jgi:hypothetical protein
MRLDKKIPIKLYELAFLGSTRAALGLGIGLLVAHRLNRPQRQVVGTTLAVVGALSTIPLGIKVLKKAGVFQTNSSQLDGFRRTGRERNVREQSSLTW